MPQTGERFRIRQLDRLVRVVECPACGLVYKETFATPACLARIYSQAYAHHALPRPEQDWGAAEYVRRMKARKGTRHLDYGCGNGSVVLCARGMGLDSYGLDPFLPAFLSEGDAHTCFLKGGVHSEVLRSMEPFDAISMWAVIEHLEDPMDVFSGLACVLKPGGRVLFNAPNADSLIAKRDGGHWAVALLVEHSTFWTRRALDYLASAAGLAVETLKRYGTPYPLNRRKDDWQSFGIPGPDTRGDACLPVGAEQGTACRPAEVTCSRRLIEAARKGVKNRFVGCALRAALHVTGVGDHYFVSMGRCGTSCSGSAR